MKVFIFTRSKIFCYFLDNDLLKNCKNIFGEFLKNIKFYCLLVKWETTSTTKRVGEVDKNGQFRFHKNGTKCDVSLYYMVVGCRPAFIRSSTSLFRRLDATCGPHFILLVFWNSKTRKYENCSRHLDCFSFGFLIMQRLWPARLGIETSGTSFIHHKLYIN